MMLPLLPFLSAASIALLKPGSLPKSQMPSRNAERHLQRHTALKKTASTVLPLPDIPPLRLLRLKISLGRKLALASLLKPIPVKSFLYFAPSLAPPPPTTSNLANFPNCHTPVDYANHLSSHLQSYFSTQTRKPFRSTEKAQMNHIRTAHCNTLHSTFCSPFSSLELSTAISQLSTSTSSGPDQITYPLLTHLPHSALHFFYISSTFLGQRTPSRLPGSNQQSSPFSNRENPLIHLLHIDPFLSLPVPPNSSKEWF